MTWRASPDWGKKLGYSSEQITDLYRKSIELLWDIRREYDGAYPSHVYLWLYQASW